MPRGYHNWRAGVQRVRTPAGGGGSRAGRGRADARASVDRGRIFVWITIGAGAATAACAIPAAIYLARDVRHPRVVVAPTVAPGGPGLVLTGRS